MSTTNDARNDEGESQATLGTAVYRCALDHVHASKTAALMCDAAFAQLRAQRGPHA